MDLREANIWVDALCETRDAVGNRVETLPGILIEGLKTSNE